MRRELAALATPLPAQRRVARHHGQKRLGRQDSGQKASSRAGIAGVDDVRGLHEALDPFATHDVGIGPAGFDSYAQRPHGGCRAENVGAYPQVGDVGLSHGDGVVEDGAV